MKNDFLTQLREERNDQDLSCLDLVSVDQLTNEDIDLLFRLARIFRDSGTKKWDILKDISVVNAFFESSTRTHSSFEFAGKQLGSDVVNISGGTAEKKKENILDIAQTLDVMGPRVVIIRTKNSGFPQQVIRHTAASVVNAGDGWHEHPSQGLLDALTAVDEFGYLEGKVVTFIGDILHSRVFGSTARIFRALGAKIRIASPMTFIPEKIEEVFGAEVFLDVEQALPGTDIVYTLRVQSERGATGDIPTLREYSKAFGISEKRLALANKGAIVMHPGPVQRDIDIHHIFATQHPQSRVLQQVNNGLAIRKAILWLLGTRKKEKEFIRI